MSLAEQYNEHPAAALDSCDPHITRVGARVVGKLGNDGHTYGWHLSPARLIGTGHENDTSLRGRNLPIVDRLAGCAIDISADWPASGEWLDDVRRRTKAGELDQVAEIIGDPDLIPGAPRDIKDACYAAPSTGWEWVEYHGQGHVTWCHLGIWRRCANDTTLGNQLLGGWTATGPRKADDYMGAIIVPPTGISIPGVKPGATVDSGWLLLAIYQHVLGAERATITGSAADVLRDTALQTAVDRLGAELARLARTAGGNVDVAAILAGVNDAVDRVLPAVVAKVDDDLQRIGAALAAGPPV